MAATQIEDSHIGQKKSLRNLEDLSDVTSAQLFLPFFCGYQLLNLRFRSKPSLGRKHTCLDRQLCVSAD